MRVLITYSGTASLAAKNMNRRWISIEQSSYYCSLIKKRLNPKIKRFFRYE